MLWIFILQRCQLLSFILKNDKEQSVNPLNFVSELVITSVILCGFSPMTEIFLTAVSSMVILLESIKFVITTLAHRRIRQGMCFVNVIWYLHVAFKFLLVLMYHRGLGIVSELFLLWILILLAAGILKVSRKIRVLCFTMPLTFSKLNENVRIQELCEEILISDLLFPWINYWRSITDSLNLILRVQGKGRNKTSTDRHSELHYKLNVIINTFIFEFYF